MKTPDWIIEGFDSKADWEKTRQKAEPLSSSSESQTKRIKSEKKGRSSAYTKKVREPLRGPKVKNSGGKTFKIKICPKCGSDDVKLVLSNSDAEQGGGKEWQCKKCGWKGEDITEKELTEDEFMKYLDEKGEEVA